MHNACAKTNDQVGDATSTTEALWYAIVNEATRLLPRDSSITSKKTASEVKKMIDSSKEIVISKLEAMAKQIESEEELIASARVSVEDEHLAQLIGSAQWKLGKDGVIIAEETNDTVSSIEYVRGIRIDNGMGAPIMMTNPEKGTLEISNAATILTNYTVGTDELLALKQKIFAPLIASGKTLVVIVARAFTADAIKLCQESVQTGFGIIPINAPYTNQTQIMKDLETVLGGRHIDVEESRLEDIQLSDIGWCEKLVAARFDAVFTGTDNEQSRKRAEKRVEFLEKSLKGEQSDFM
jgi:chaperonin GroEL